jgi:hypothetical protein
MEVLGDQEVVCRAVEDQGTTLHLLRLKSIGGAGSGESHLQLLHSGCWRAWRVLKPGTCFRRLTIGPQTACTLAYDAFFLQKLPAGTSLDS